MIVLKLRDGSRDRSTSACFREQLVDFILQLGLNLLKICEASASSEQQLANSSATLNNLCSPATQSFMINSKHRLKEISIDISKESAEFTVIQRSDIIAEPKRILISLSAHKVEDGPIAVL